MRINRGGTMARAALAGTMAAGVVLATGGVAQAAEMTGYRSCPVNYRVSVSAYTTGYAYHLYGGNGDRTFGPDARPTYHYSISTTRDAAWAVLANTISGLSVRCVSIV
jgi:hypothetical protein